MAYTAKESKFEFSGGAVCLDFTNTVDNRPTDHRQDLLLSYAELVCWAGEANLLTPKQTQGLYSLSERSPQESQLVLRRALQLREAIFDIFAALVHKHALPAEALAILNQNLQDAAIHTKLAMPNPNGSFVWQLDFLDVGLEAVLWPIARSAGELLTSGDVHFVRECAADTCRWLFLDKTKNHRRRWCDMKVCGNRAKARRFYARQRADS